MLDRLKRVLHSRDYEACREMYSLFDVDLSVLINCMLS